MVTRSNFMVMTWWCPSEKYFNWDIKAWRPPCKSGQLFYICSQCRCSEILKDKNAIKNNKWIIFSKFS